MKSISFIKNLIVFCVEKNVSQHAKALSFSTLLSIVPLLSIFLSSFASSNWMGLAKDKLQLFFLDNLLPKQMQTVFVDYLNVMAENATHIKTVGLILFFISILFLFMDIENSFYDLAHDKNKPKWHWRMLSIVSFFFVPLIFFGLIALANFIFSQSPQLVQTIFLSILEYKLIIDLVLALLVWIFMAFLYIVIPNKRTHWKASLVGALVTTVFFIISQQAFSLYLSYFSTYNLIYGVFSIIPIFILWIYINWQIVLYGFAITLFCKSDGTLKTVPLQENTAPSN